jgi:hypothetical protein
MSKKNSRSHKTISNEKKIEDRNKVRSRAKEIEIETLQRIDDADYGVARNGKGVGEEDILHDERERESKSQDAVRNEMNARRVKPKK